MLREGAAALQWLRASTQADGPTGWPVFWRRAGLALPVVFFAIYTASSLLRDHQLGTAAYDLGIFDQAVAQYAHFNAPMTPLMGPGFNNLGDHFSPILAVLAPFYWIWPDRRMLLVAQAALLAVSIIPVVRVTARRLGQWAGFAVGVAYGLSWGLQGLVGYDFHQVAFAIPLTAFAMAALVEGRYRAVALWALPLLLVKEDLGLTVAAIGLCLLLRRQRRLGVGLAVAGFGTFLLTTLVIIPHFDHLFHTYRYWGVVGGARSNTAPACRFTTARARHRRVSPSSAAGSGRCASSSRSCRRRATAWWCGESRRRTRWAAAWCSTRTRASTARAARRSCA